MASAILLVRLAVATARAGARVAALAVAALAVAAGRAGARVGTLAAADGAGANTVPRVRPGDRAGQPRGRELLEGLAGRAMPRAGGPGGRLLAADQAVTLAGRTIVRARAAIVRARAVGLAGPAGRTPPGSVARPVQRTEVPGSAALMVAPRPAAGRAGPTAQIQVTGPAGPALQVRAAIPAGRAPARTRTDGGASRVPERAPPAGRVARTARSGGRRDGGTTAQMAHDPPAAGSRAKTTHGSAGNQGEPTRGRARHKVARAALTGVLGLPNADPTGRARRGPARAAMTGPGTGQAGLAPGLARAATTSPGSGQAGLVPGLARAAGRCPNRRQADGTRTGLRPNPVATGRTVAGQPDLAGRQERAPAGGRDSM